MTGVGHHDRDGSGRRRQLLELGARLAGCRQDDLIEQVVNLCRYQHRDPEITTELLDVACRSYFIEDSESTAQETNS